MRGAQGGSQEDEDPAGIIPADAGSTHRIAKVGDYA